MSGKRRCQGCVGCENGDPSLCWVSDADVAGCCAQFHQQIDVQYIPPACEYVVPTFPTENPAIDAFGLNTGGEFRGTAQWVAADNKYVGTIWHFTTAETYAVELYFEEVGDDCYLKLRIDDLGLTVGSEEEWLLTLPDDCTDLKKSATLASGGMVSVVGTRLVTGAGCATQCCHCYTLALSGTVDFGSSSFPFNVTLALGTPAGPGDPRADGRCWTWINGGGFVSMLFGSPVLPGNPYYPAPCYGYIVFHAQLAGRTLSVSVFALVQGGVDTNHDNSAEYNVFGTYSDLYVFDVDPHFTDDACVNLTINSLCDTINLRSYTFPADTSRGVYTGTDCLPVEGDVLTITLDTPTELVYDDTCEEPSFSSLCNGMPSCLMFSIYGVTDDDCDECDQLVGRFNLAAAGGTTVCRFASAASLTACAIAVGGAYAQWVLAVDSVADEWELSYVIYDVDGNALGTLVVYTLTDSVLTVFPKTLTLDSSSSECATWSATIALHVCTGVPTYGGCCQDGDSTGIGICGEVDEATCTSSNGTWLGESTSCCDRACNACPDSNEDSTLILRNITNTEEHQFSWDAVDGRWECADDIDGQGYQPFAIECGYGTCGAGEFAIYPISLIVGETCIPATGETFTLFTQSYRLNWDGC